MKKIICAALVVLMCLPLACCKGVDKVEEDEFRVVVYNYTGEEISGVNMEYFVEDKSLGTVFVANGEKKIADKESIYTDFNKDMFEGYPEVLMEFSVKCTVTSEDNKTYDCSNKMEFIAEYENTYYFLMDGSQKTTYHLTSLSSPIE